MKMEGGINKFEQISGIFSQFSEENKDKLLETAKNLLKAQREEIAFQTEVNAIKGHCPEK
jgi:hypothetical protein